MIKIEFSLAIALYIALTVSLVLILWLILERKKVIKFSSAEDRFFWQCNICTYVYVDSKNSVISQCPRCRSYNKKEEVAHA